MEHDSTSPGAARRPHRRQDPVRSRLTLVDTERWTHTLVLTGELHGRSATALEEEIESLCREGVAALRLDLRQLSSIDEAGLAVIAFRSRECARQGCAIEVLAEMPAVCRSLTEAGVALAAEPADSVSEARALPSDVRSVL